MKNRIAAGFFFVTLFLFAMAGCATLREPIWPSESPEIYSIWYVYEPVASKEEARANIKNLMNSISIDGLNPSDIDIDDYSVRAKLKWTENKYYNTKSTSYNSYWIGTNYNIDAIDTYHTNIATINKEKTAIMELKELNSIMIFSDNSIQFWFNNNSGLWIQAGSMWDAKKLTNSIYTLAKTVGARLAPSIGVNVRDLTAEQKEQLGIDSGVRVSGVEKGGPGDKAGIEVNDVILEMNGSGVTKAGQFWDAISGTPRGKASALKVMKWDASEDQIKWKKKKISVTPVSQ